MRKLSSFFTVAFVLSLLLPPSQALAYTDHVFGPIVLRQWGAGESFAIQGNTGVKRVTASGNFSSAEMREVGVGMNFWTERLQSSQSPRIVLDLGYVHDDDGTAFNNSPDNGKDNADLFDYVVNGKFNGQQSGFTGHTAVIFQKGYEATPTRALFNDHSVVSTMSHEFMHALGVGGALGNYAPQTPTGDWAFVKGVNAWTTGLHDIYGTKAKVDMSVERMVIAKGQEYNDVFYLPSTGADIFTLEADQKTYFATFHGAHVDALTGGRGMPVMSGLDKEYKIDGGNVLGHPALLGSIMSYSPLRNMMFTEMELAVLKDMGYNIDLKKSYGKSYYATNLGGVLTKDDTTSGGAGKGGYLAETALTTVNTAGFNSDYSFGVGLHVYRDKLDVTQAANIKASGYGASGIRVDGVGNTVTVGKNVNVDVNGAYGTGVLVAYGRNNTVNVSGNVRATGYGGIGAHFGTGMYRSYYYWDPTKTTDKDGNVITNNNKDEEYFYSKMNSDLNGALVDTFHVSGLLQGSQAAIQIDNTAHVKNIALHNGAVLIGGIHSSWAANTVTGKDYDTDIVVGDAGSAGHIYLQGDIRWVENDGYTGSNDPINSLNVQQKGDYLHFNGKANVQTWKIDHGATLGGNSDIIVVGSNPLSNAGTIAPGNSIGQISITGDFKNEANGALSMEFTASQSDRLLVSGTATVDAGSALVLTPLRDFYASNVQRVITNDQLFGSKMAQTSFATSLGSIISPTLHPSLGMTAGGEAAFVVTRDANAYSQYASRHNSRNVGRALDGIVNVAKGDMGQLFAALDFSPVDGSVVSDGLKQLSPASYGYSAQASAENNLSIGRMALTQLRGLAPGKSGARGLSGGSAGADASQWTAFVTPFANTATQQQDGDIQGYNSSQAGLMAGFTREQNGLALGLYTAFAHRQTNVWTSAGAENKGASLHVGGMAEWQPEPTGWRVFAQAQLGLENADTTRKVDFNDYTRENRAFQTAFSGTAMLGGGWQWQVDNMGFGPYVGLEYALNTLPGFEEWNGQGSRLHMDGFTRHDVRAVGGVNLAYTTALGEANEGRQLKATLDAAWRQDVLSPEYTMTSSFVGYGEYGFDTTVKRQGAGSLGLAGSLQVDVRKDVTLGAHVQTEVLREGYTALGGGMSLRWEF